MRSRILPSLAITAALLGGGCPADEDQEPDVEHRSIEARAPAAGTAYTKTTAAKLEVTGMADLGAIGTYGRKQIDQTFSETRREVVLECSPDAVLALEVSYPRREIDGDLRDGLSPLAGHTYRVARADDQLTASRVEGSELVDVSDEELERLELDYRYLGRPDPRQTLLCAQSFPLGVTIDVATDQVVEAFGLGAFPELSVRGARIRLDEIREGEAGEEAVFRVYLRLKGELDGVQASASLRGDLRVLVAGGWPLTTELEGEISLSGHSAERDVDVTGTGTCTLSESWSYEPTTGGE
jgi:hypothetical protein